MQTFQRLTTNLWFDDQAEHAAEFYTGIFRNAKITGMSYYGEEGKEIHGRLPGSVMTVAFELDGTRFLALNGGPVFRFSEAISFIINCKDQQELDYYWEKLGEGGDPASQQCGWLKDKFGLSWQVVPLALEQMVSDPDRTKANRMMKALMKMRKLDIEKLQKAFNGESWEE